MLNKLHTLGRRVLKSSAAPLLQPLRAGMRRFNGGSRSGEQVTILAYHRIVEDIAHAERESELGMVTSTGTFRRQMELVREQCEALTLDEAAAVLRGRRRTERPAVAITFDDGYRDAYEQAWPILRELKLPATIFLPTAFIGAGQMLDHDRFYRAVLKAHSRGLSLRVPLTKAGLGAERVSAVCAEVNPQRVFQRVSYLPLAERDAVLRCLDEFIGDERKPSLNGFSLLDWKMVREMADAGISFGAHTDNHVILTLEDEQTVENEVLRSKLTLEAKLGRAVRHFAYPTGRYNDLVRAAVAQAGFDTAVTTERRLNRPGDDLFTLGRICLCEESTRGVTGRYSEAVARLRLGI